MDLLILTSVVIIIAILVFSAWKTFPRKERLERDNFKRSLEMMNLFRSAIIPVVERTMRTLHSRIYSTVQKHNNYKKNQTCDKCSIKKIHKCTIKKIQSCRLNICNMVLKEIQNMDQSRKKQRIYKMDAQRWHEDPMQIARCFASCPLGEDLDIQAYVNIILNCTEFIGFMGNTDGYRKINKLRNEFIHGEFIHGECTLTSTRLQEFGTLMLVELKKLKNMYNDPEVTEATSRIEQIMQEEDAKFRHWLAVTLLTVIAFYVPILISNLKPGMFE